MSTLRHCTRCGNDYPADAAFCPVDGSQLAAVPGGPEPGPKTGVVLDDRYLLEEQIGAGGLGEIYRAKHLRMQRAFAVKLLQQSMVKRPDFVGRFQREARALSRLTHPCCVAVTDFGISEEHGPFIVMELVEGVPLSHFSRGEGLPLGEALDIIIAVLAGLDHAHRQGIVHRDIKPDNIMIVEQPLGAGQRMPKILDFGLAKIRAGFNAPAGQTLTEAGFVIGTPHYLAPERVTNPSADDPRSDLYAVGVISFELCCGRKPFEAEETPRVVEMHLSQAPPSPRQLRPDLPLALEVAIMRALQKQPQARFVSAREFRDALEHLLPLPPELAARRPADAPPPREEPTRPDCPPSGDQAPAPRRPAAARPLLARRPALLLGGAAAIVLAGVVATFALLGGDSRPPIAARRPSPSTSPRRVVKAARPDARRPAVATTRPAREPGPQATATAAEGNEKPADGHPTEKPPTDEHPTEKPPTDEQPIEEPPSAATASLTLPAELRQSYRLWRLKRARPRASRQFESYLAQHRDDAAAHLFVGRLYLFALWAHDGIKLVQEALQLDPRLRLDGETVVGLALAYRGPSMGAARRLIEEHAGPDVPRALLAAAVVMPDRAARRHLLEDARQKLGTSPLERSLLALAAATGCEQRRVALAGLPSLGEPCVQVMLAMLRLDCCLARTARDLRRRASH